MKILFVYSVLQTGFDPVIPALIQELQIGNTVTYQSAENDVATSCVCDICQEEYDAVILVDALRWYLKNRLKLVGRPWVCLVSFSFETLTPYIRIPSADSGVNAIFSNCPVFPL